ncbi:MAG: hypothetical protein GY699_20495 [Desulfobacteraceae bacterium]|nr:hypothetical protein [Desulfobacteraceae bacterium]
MNKTSLIVSLTALALIIIAGLSLFTPQKSPVKSTEPSQKTAEIAKKAPPPKPVIVYLAFYENNTDTFPGLMVHPKNYPQHAPFHFYRGILSVKKDYFSKHNLAKQLKKAYIDGFINRSFLL